MVISEHRLAEADSKLAEIEKPAAPVIPDKAPEVEGTSWKDVQKNAAGEFSVKGERAYADEAEFLKDYEDNGLHDAGETAEEFLRRRYCAGRG